MSFVAVPASPSRHPHRTARLVALLPATLLPATLLAVLAGCTPAESSEEPKTRTYTFKAFSGVSMGAIGAAFNTGFGDNHEKVDALAVLGGPMDVGFFIGGMERSQLGGFCPLSELERVAAEDAENGTQQLNDPQALAHCSGPVPAGIGYEVEQHYNGWYYEASGGDFDRNMYLQLFLDLSLAMGNPFYWNPESPLFPVSGITREQLTSKLCEEPVVVKGFFNKEYNPDGKYDVITFCDGEAPSVLFCNDEERTLVDYCSDLSPDQFCASLGATVAEARRDDKNTRDVWYRQRGKFDPCYRHTTPSAFGLALDINGNGRRDYHEPLLINGRERFEDTGADGCPDAREDGKGGCCAAGVTGCATAGVADPNGDNFHFDDNPLGTENNRLWDPGEPYEDTGLDGVAGTGDFGEGNGRYDLGPNFQRFLDHDFRQRYLAMTEAQRRSIDFYADGGVHDIFNFGLSADHVHSAMRALSPNDSFRYHSFFDLPKLPGTATGKSYSPDDIDFERMGRNVFVRYGNPDATPAQRWAGDGGHVGTPAELIGRFLTFIRWMGARWDVVLGEPDMTVELARRGVETYFSEVLGANRSFGLALPPGYDEFPERRYPVLFIGHGYGMSIHDMVDMSLLFNELMSTGRLREMIIVYPSGRCCYENPADGHRDCRDADDDGVPFTQPNPAKARPAYVSECVRGNFYVNRQGYFTGDETRYGDAIFELMDHVDANYRTLEPRTVTLPE